MLGLSPSLSARGLFRWGGVLFYWVLLSFRNYRVVRTRRICPRACTRVFSLRRLANDAALAVPDDHATSDPVHGPLITILVGGFYRLK